MKKLTLGKTWSECLRMWKWIAEQKKKHNTKLIPALKGEWLDDNDYGEDDIANDCFFCDYALNKSDSYYIGVRDEDCCKYCPARKIDADFLCMYRDYDFEDRPIQFYAKLVELNEIRLSKKRTNKRKK